MDAIRTIILSIVHYVVNITKHHCVRQKSHHFLKFHGKTNGGITKHYWIGYKSQHFKGYSMAYHFVFFPYTWKRGTTMVKKKANLQVAAFRTNSQLFRSHFASLFLMIFFWLGWFFTTWIGNPFTFTTPWPMAANPNSDNSAPKQAGCTVGIS